MVELVKNIKKSHNTVRKLDGSEFEKYHIENETQEILGSLPQFKIDKERKKKKEKKKGRKGGRRRKKKGNEKKEKRSYGMRLHE